MKILGTGLNGLIGSRIVELMSGNYTFENLSRSTGVDITNYQQVQKAIADSTATVVLHLAGYTNVKAAEEQRTLGTESEAWKINVVGTEHLVRACEETGKKLIYASTDLIFDGQDTPSLGYSEEDAANPLNWYAQTKYEGELRVKASKTPWLVIRPAYPYRATFEKNDFVRLFKQKLSQNEELTVLTDRIITPVFIDDLAGAVELLIRSDSHGIYHTVGSTALSIHDAAVAIAEVFAYDKSLIKASTRAEMLVGKPPEPFNSALNNAKIKQLGAVMRTFREGVEQIKIQEEEK